MIAGIKSRIRVKVCCIKSVAEAQLAINAGVDALGLVSQMPGGPGVISEVQIAEIAKRTPPTIATFLLTSKVEADEIIAQQKYCKSNVIQLVDHLTPDKHQQIKTSLPGIGLVQVVHIIDETSVTQAIAYAEHVDALLLDSGNPGLKVKELGGTGRTHNWALSREIVKRVNVPVFLAGGLHPGNVATAINEVKPFGIDICSGLRVSGNLDASRLAAFMANVKT